MRVGRIETATVREPQTQLSVPKPEAARAVECRAETAEVTTEEEATSVVEAETSVVGLAVVALVVEPQTVVLW